MAVYLTSLANGIGAGVCAGANAFLSMTPYGQAATVVAAIAIPIIFKSRQESTQPLLPAVPVVPNPLQLTRIKEWEFEGDTRKVTLYRTPSPGDLLICQVFDRATNQTSQRYLRGKGPAFERNLLQNMHPELANAESQPTCTAMFIKSDLVEIGKSYGGLRGNVEVRLFRAQDGTLTWVAADTDTNKVNVWGEMGAGVVRERVLDTNYIREVGYDNAGFPNSVSFGTKKILSWNVDDKEVSILRSRASLRYEILDSAGGIACGPIPIPEGTTVELFITILKRSFPVIQDNGTLGIAKRTSFQSELSDDDSDFVDENTWAVRLVDTGRFVCRSLENATLESFTTVAAVGELARKCVKDLDRLSDAGGHAAILIEGVDAEGYFMRVADMIIHSQTGRPFIRSFKITSTFLSDYKDKIQCLSSDTWLKPKEDIEKMLSAIEKEKREQGENGVNSKIVYSPLGFDPSTKDPISYLYLYGRNLLFGRGRKGVFDLPHNCMSWAKEKLDIASIDFLRWYDLRRLLALDHLSAPKLYLDPVYMHQSFLGRVTNNPYITPAMPQRTLNALIQKAWEMTTQVARNTDTVIREALAFTDATVEPLEDLKDRC